ncbi:ankyrin repeat domain-containing protein [Mesorhizobium sp.]|uniref:ankyrin repeat domain-containing protein n=1 Tax=Mesorhizobium sp. TaxID=1871066 RepID=UPI000FE2C0FA|nr:ankyrin repeat domain-containing protein [Mesorhizobium sp.]RWA59543.1 MAG: c-type cytochrome [Mesorhizobium sp.]RWB93493.1 MAG: c-type cytochrome [Mesorhizobium sp.]RWG76653.1 MAG: c-type cytochrome [Mesorhizobium sp.]RWG77433.1 MAG: c-type cytochrome [Mesorhizobium sp.]RWK01361.1 MAG: c-type cytochrome [Mesorhizobium sp.]
MRELIGSVLIYLAALTVAQSGPLHQAAKSGDLAAITAALNAGADLEEMEKGATPLFLAVRSGHPEAAELLIQRGADVNKESALGLPITVAVLKNSVDLMRLLLAHGAHANTAVRGEPILHLAVANGCLDCVKVLVEAGADVNAIWIQGDPTDRPAIITPYHLARHDDHVDIAAYLLAHGVVIPKPEPISAKLAKGDPAKGAAFFAATCAPCHGKRAQDIAGIGPNLWNVVGRDKASTKFDRYSKTLLAWDGSWTYEDLNIFLAGPTLTTPGVNMDVRGAPDETDRLNVIAYLRTLADSPVPLP